jgi:hypothetical protein
MSQQQILPIQPLFSIQQQNQYNYSSVNSQQGLADKIQAVRHLWETEKPLPDMQQSIQNFPYG